MNLNTTWTQAPTSRTLKSNDSRAVKIYIQKVRKNLDTHNVFQRMKALLQELEGQTVLKEYQKNIYESIDNDVYRLCINAENKVKKKMYGKFLWSPKLDKAVLTTQYWASRKQYMGSIDQTE